MTASSVKSSRFNSASRCTHLSAAGSRCRLNASSGSLCTVHARAESAHREAEDLSVTLTADLDRFTTAEPINQFLSRLLLLLAQDRISPRRGAVMAYTANLLLRSVTVMQHEAGKNAAPPIIEYVIGIPRPGDDPSPQPDTVSFA